MRLLGLRRVFGADAAVDLAEVVVAKDVAEVFVVENPLEDLVVGVHPGDDGLQELAVEHEPEVVECVVLRLVGELAVGDPALLELVEQELVDVGQVQCRSAR